jgi:hypothetical protein
MECNENCFAPLYIRIKECEVFVIRRSVPLEIPRRTSKISIASYALWGQGFAFAIKTVWYKFSSG